MTLTNYKTQSKIQMMIELEAWRSGEKQVNVSNQHNEYVLESALSNIDKMNDDQWEWWMNSDASIMGLANALSQFDAPEIDSAWID